MTEPADRSSAPAQSWLTKAGDDLAIADLVLNSEIGVEWTACFHAQQAAEKAVKACSYISESTFQSRTASTFSPGCFPHQSMSDSTSMR